MNKREEILKSVIKVFGTQMFPHLSSVINQEKYGLKDKEQRIRRLKKKS